MAPIRHKNLLRLTDAAPFTTTKQKIHTQVFKLPNSVLAKEVICCAHFIYHNKTYEKKEDNPLYNPNKKRIMMPKPSRYTREQLMEFFLQNKTIKLQSMDLAYIWAQIFLYSRSLTQEIDSKNLKPDTTSWDRGSWDGIVPNVRLIEIVLSDEF
jgi:hypothetical protein